MDGGSLRDHLIRHGTGTPAEAVRFAGQVAAALAEAHELGIIHRDLKPDNILLDSSLQNRLTDFGIARAYSSTNSSPGTRRTEATPSRN